MKTEISAGGVIVCPVHHQWYVLVLKDMNNTWTFPKGLNEDGEKLEDTANREIKEEVGLTGLKLVSPLTPIQYVYKRRNTVKKTVHYFIFLSMVRRKPNVQKAEGIREARWVPINHAIGMIGYRQTNVTLLEEAWKLLKQQTYKC